MIMLESLYNLLFNFSHHWGNQNLKQLAFDQKQVSLNTCVLYINLKCKSSNNVFKSLFFISWFKQIPFNCKVKYMPQSHMLFSFCFFVFCFKHLNTSPYTVHHCSGFRSCFAVAVHFSSSIVCTKPFILFSLGAVCHPRLSQEERVYRCLPQPLWNVSQQGRTTSCVQ